MKMSYTSRNIILSMFFVYTTLFTSMIYGLENDSLKDRSGKIKFENRTINQRLDPIKLPDIKLAPQNMLFNECYYCQEENRLWYSSLNDLYEASKKCGLDYIEVRIDQMFVKDKNVLLTMVYCSINKSNLFLDSVVYVLRTSSASQKKVAITTTDKQNFYQEDYLFSSPVINDGTIVQDIIDTLNQKISNFSSKAEILPITNSLSYHFQIYKTRYLVVDTRVEAKSSDFREEPQGSIAKSIKKYYKIGKINKNYNCEQDKVLKNEEDTVCIQIRDRYIYNQCIIDYSVSSLSGISEIEIQCDSLINKTISFNGEKKISSFISVGFGNRLKYLTFCSTNINGKKSCEKIEIFRKFEEKQIEKEKKITLQKSRKVWARKSMVNASIDYLGKFEGNVISLLADYYCEGQAEESLLRIPDVFDSTNAHHFSFPTEGRVPYILQGYDTVGTLYNITSKLFAQHIYFNGTTIASLSNPSLHSYINKDSVLFVINVPMGTGYYVPKWVCPKDDTSQTDIKMSQVVICRNVVQKNKEIILNEIPMRERDPFKDISYALVVNLSNSEKDTLILSYIGKTLDRTYVNLNRVVEINNNNNNENQEKISYRNVSIRYKNSQHKLSNGEKMILIEEKLSCKDKMLSLYIFVYSKHKSTTIGAGCIWVE